MKLFQIIAPLAIAATLAGCAAKTTPEADAANAVDPKEQATSIEAVDTSKGIIDLANDSALRPGMKVDQLTFIDFNATWCGPCKLIAPSFHALANDFIGRVTFYSVDIDRCPETAKAFGVEAIPTFVLIRTDGRTERFVGTDSFATDTELNRASNIEEVTSIILPRMREVLDKNLK